LYHYETGGRILAEKQQNIHLRVDFIHGAYPPSGFYIAFGEAF
jgi:hypothetical protein